MPVRKFKHTAIRIVAAVAILLLAAGITIQLPSVQTALADQLLDPVRSGMNGNLTFKSIKILPFSTVIVNDFLISDNNPYGGSFFKPQDTVLFIHKAVVRLSLKSLTDKDGISISKVTVTGGQLSTTKDGEGNPNFPKVFNKLPPVDFPEIDADKMPLIRIRKVTVHNFMLRILDPKLEEKPYRGHGINWADFEGVADAYAHDITVKGLDIKGTLDDFNVVEKCGYRMLHADGTAEYSMGHVTVTEFHMNDLWSEVYLPKFEMFYNRPVDFRNYVDSVRMRGAIRNSTVSLKTVGYFGQTFKDATTSVEVPLAIFDGTTNRLAIDEFIFNEEHGISGRFSGEVSDASIPGMLTAKADIKRLSFTTSSLSAMLNSTGMLRKPLNIGTYASGERMTLKGRISGRPDRLDINAFLSSAIGTVSAKGIMNTLTNADGSEISTSLSILTDDLDIGAIIGNDAVHECTLGARFSARAKGKEMSMNLDSLHIDRLNLLDYDYSGIAAAGTFSENSFNGKIISADPNLNFLFQGIFNLSKETRNALYRFYCNIGYADLNALHLDKRGISKASAEITADYADLDRRHIIGNIDIRDINLENAEGNHEIGDISIVSRRAGGLYRANLKSKFADIAFSGPKSIADFIGAVQDLTTKRMLPALHRNPETRWSGESYSLDVKLGDTRDIMSFALPGGYMADGTALKLRVSEDGLLNGSIHSQRLAMKTNYLKDIDISATNANDSLSVNMNSSALSIGQYLFLNNSLGLSAFGDRFDLKYTFDNKEEKDTSGDINLSGGIDRENGLTLVVDAQPSDITINDHHWEVEASTLQVDSTGIRLDSLGIYCGEQELSLWGGYSRTRVDTLNIDMKDFKLGEITDLLGTKTSFRGSINGGAMLTSPFRKQAGIVIDMRSDSTYINGHPAGTVNIVSKRSEDSHEMDIAVSNDIGGHSNIAATGTIFPEENRIAALVKMDSLCLGYLSGAASSIFSQLDGSISGDLSLIGPFDNLSIFSRNGSINDGLIEIAFTEVPYSISGPFKVNNDGVRLDGITISDMEKGTGTISGGLVFDHLKDMAMAMHINMNDMKVLDKDRSKYGEPIYGTIFADGGVDITGPFDALKLSAEATTTGDGDIFIPLGNGQRTTDNDLLTFKKEEVWVDPYDEMISSSLGVPGVKKKQSGLGIDLNLNVTPDVFCQINLDKSSDNGIKGRGNGAIKINLAPPSSTIDLRGIYSLYEGNFHFSVAGLAKRDFEISNGSYISFVGDIMDSDLDINAVYTTKTSVERIFGEQAASASRRTVNCGLHVFNKLRNPQLGFSIDVPDLSPEAQSYLLSAINTEDKLQKQFLSLIVSNSFLPNDEAGIVNNTNVLLSNAAEIMAGQLNNILQMLKIPLDLGLNYQQASGGTNIFDVAVSTQLFNNRVSVNGTFGNRMNTTSQQDFVGDLDIEMKLDKSGKIRATLFSHSADKFTNFLDNSQRNGIGVSYQTEFNTFKEFLSNLFRTKKEREARKAARFQSKKYKTIRISSDNNE